MLRRKMKSAILGDRSHDGMEELGYQTLGIGGDILRISSKVATSRFGDINLSNSFLYATNVFLPR